MAGTEDAISQHEVLEGVAELAKQGYRGQFVAGKVKTGGVKENQTTKERLFKFDVICNEGSTITLKLPETAARPAIGHIGAFMIDNIREYMNRASADCLAFA